MKDVIVEFVQMSLNTVFAFSVHRIKQKLIGEYIYKSITWWEFMRPVIASILVDGKVWKAPNIHKNALLCMFISTLKWI